MDKSLFVHKGWQTNLNTWKFKTKDFSKIYIYIYLKSRKRKVNIFHLLLEHSFKSGLGQAKARSPKFRLGYWSTRQGLNHLSHHLPPPSMHLELKHARNLELKVELGRNSCTLLRIGCLNHSTKSICFSLFAYFVSILLSFCGKFNLLCTYLGTNFELNRG